MKHLNVTGQEDVGRISSIVFGEMCGLTGTVWGVQSTT